jgi:mono/diheme cytochrome c family protein
MSRRAFEGGLLALAMAVGAAGTARADAAAGAQLAKMWCSSCHVVAAGQRTAIPQGPPSFPEVARSGVTAAQLRAFLSHPHGAMPDLALTRVEIDNLIDYIESLRQ